MPITPQQALLHLIEHRELAHDDMLELMRQIMAGQLSPVMTSAILTGLRVKQETVGEITAAAQVMRELATRVPVAAPEALLDIVGTGGDGSQTFNISTAATFVAAAAGARVAKHGNRGVSSSSGSADVLEKLGVSLSLEPEAVAQCIDTLGVGFMFAPNHHSAMKNVAPVRREMGVRTLFNIVGPLTNPAGAQTILMGVFHSDLVGLLVRVLQRLGARHALVVWGKDGLDEVSLGASTVVGELKDGQIHEYTIHPEDFGFAMASTRQLAVAGPDESAQRIRDVLKGVPGPSADVVLLNAGIALYTANVAESMEAGIKLAEDSIKSGAAYEKCSALAELTQRLSRSKTP